MQDRLALGTSRFYRRFADTLVLALALVPENADASCTTGTEQYSALSALYSAIGGASSSFSGWMSGDPCTDGSWANVDTDGTNVTGITLNMATAKSGYATLPTELGYLTKLTGPLELSQNNFEKTIPTELGSLTDMTSCGKACFFGNSFTGTLPTELGKMTDLTEADGLFAENSISGPVPTELGSWTNFQSCGKGCLSDNYLTSTLPTQLGQWGMQTAGYCVFESGMSFDNNQLSGTLPTEIGYLTSMTMQFVLEANRFSGSLPTELGLVFQAFSDACCGIDPSSDYSGDYLRFAGNSFCGAVPDEIQDAWSYETINSNLCAENQLGYSCEYDGTVEDSTSITFCEGVQEALCYEDSDGNGANPYDAGSSVGCDDDDDSHDYDSNSRPIIWLAIVGGVVALGALAIGLGVCFCATRQKPQAAGGGSSSFQSVPTGSGAGEPGVAVPSAITRSISVTVPSGASSGTTLQVTTPEGLVIQAKVPPGLRTGSSFEASYQVAPVVEMATIVSVDGPAAGAGGVVVAKEMASDI